MLVFLQREISLRMKLQSRSFRRLKFSPKKSLLSRLENSVHTHNDAPLTLNFRRKHILTCSVQMLVQVSQSHVHSFPDSLLNDLFISLSLIQFFQITKDCLTCHSQNNSYNTILNATSFILFWLQSLFYRFQKERGPKIAVKCWCLTVNVNTLSCGRFTWYFTFYVFRRKSSNFG